MRQKPMRHSDPKLTANTYTDTSQLPLMEAVNKLPVFLSEQQTKSATTSATKIHQKEVNMPQIQAIQNLSQDLDIQGINITCEGGKKWSPERVRTIFYNLLHINKLQQSAV